MVNDVQKKNSQLERDLEMTEMGNDEKKKKMKMIKIYYLLIFKMQ